MPRRSAPPHPKASPRRVAALATLALLLGACAGLPGPGSPAAFVVLRHAEKLDDGTRDPALSAAGRARAVVVAERLRHQPLAGAWASQFRRTLQTAEPAARARGIPVLRYDAADSPQALARRLRSARTAGTVLVVGHSNTVPALVAALCACEVAPLDDSQYDRWFELHPDGTGGLILRESRF